jgi:hypothetical protein
MHVHVHVHGHPIDSGTQQAAEQRGAASLSVVLCM